MSQSGNQYLLTVIDEYSRFPFAFPLRNITSSSVNALLNSFQFLVLRVSYTQIVAPSSNQRNSKNSASHGVSVSLERHRTTPRETGRTKYTTVSSGSPYSAFSTRKAGKALPGRISCLEQCPPFEPSSTPLPAKLLTIGCSTSQGRQEEVSSPRRGGYEPAVMRT